MEWSGRIGESERKDGRRWGKWIKVKGGKCNADGQTKGSSKKYLLDERIVK
jgi:hypothetical protein